MENRTNVLSNALRPRLTRLAAAIVLCGATSVLGGCHGALWGAGFGALTGQVVGGTTEATLAGAVYGSLLGAAADADHHYYTSGYTHHVHYAEPVYHGDCHYYYNY